MARATIQGSPGLHTASNPETTQPGSLQQAIGVIIKRPGIIQQSRPWRQYSSGSDSAYHAGNAGYALGLVGSFFYEFDSTFSRLYAETAIGSGVFALLNLPFSLVENVDLGDPNLHIAEALGNWYIPFAQYTVKIDTAGNTAYLAGCPRPPDPTVTLVGAGSLLANGQSVAYRVVIKRIDANGNLILSTPSGRISITATAAQNVSVKTFLPQQIIAEAATKYYVQVYRTLTFATGTNPDDECALVYDAKLTATDLANQFVTFTDSTPDTMRGAALYTSPSQQGIGAANDPPPVAQDIAYFKGSMFYANTTQKHRAHIAMLAPPEQWAIQSIAADTPIAGQSTYTFLAAVDLTGIDNTMKLSVLNSTGNSNDGNWPVVSINNGTHTVVVTNHGVAQAGVAGIAMSGRLRISQAANRYSAATNFDFLPIFSAENLAGRLFNVPATGSVSTIVAAAAASLVRCINAQGQAQPFVAYSESGPDDPPGLLMFEEATTVAGTMGGGGLTITAFGTTTVGYQGAFSNKWAPAIPTTAPLSSLNDARANRLYISKPGQPEHVPIASYLDVGAQTGAILRIIALREALLVFKEDGLFRVTGTAGVFSWAPYDTTQKLVGKSYVTTIQNKAAALTTKGVFLFSEVGFQYVSAPVADILSQFTSYTLSGKYVPNLQADTLATAAAGLSASEGDGMLYLTATDITGSVVASISYSVTTGAWTQQATGPNTPYTLRVIRVKDYRVGIDAYSASPDIWLEDQWSAATNIFTFGVAPGQSFSELSFTGNLAAKEPVPGHKGQISISNVNAGAKQITATSVSNISPALAVGAVIRTNNNAGGTGSFYKVTVVAGAVLTLASLAGPDNFDFVVGRGYQYFGQAVTVEWNPYTAEDEAMLKQWAEVAVILDPLSTPTAKAITVGAWSENFPAASMTMQAIATASTYERIGLQKETAVSRRLSVRFQHSNPLEYIFIKGPTYEYEPAEADRATN